MSTPTVTPSKIRKGTTAKWTRYFADYAPSAWTLTYYFTNGTSANSMAATNNNDGSFLITIPATGTGVSTDDFAAGDWTYVAQVAKSPEVFEVESGTIEILASLTSAVDSRSFAKKMIDAIETALASGRGVLSISVSTPLGSRTISYESRQAMIEARKVFLSEYARERQAQRALQGQSSRRRVNERFGS